MRVLVLGAGNISYAVVSFLASEEFVDEIFVVDLFEENLKRLKSFVGSEKVRTFRRNVLKDSIGDLVGRCDVISSLLPGHVGEAAYKISIEYGVDLVDTAYINFDPYKYDDLARDSGITIVPDAGFAPGISNLLVGYASTTYDRIKFAKIYVGGLPDKPYPPINHLVNWSVRDLLEEYVRPVKIIKGGEIVIVEPLDGFEIVDFGNLGSFEAFYTDGLRTLTKNIIADEMYEKTIRYRGHVSFIKALKELGFLSKKPIKVNGFEVSPFEVTYHLFREKIFKPDMRDLAILKVFLGGFSRGKFFEKVFTLVCRYDESRGLSAMAKTTGSLNVATIKLLYKYNVGKGVKPPEVLGMNEIFYKFILKDLYERGVKIVEE